MGEAGMSRRALDCFQLLLLETHFGCPLWRLISTLALVIGKYSTSWVAAPSLMESAKGSEACGFGVRVSISDFSSVWPWTGYFTSLCLG